MTAHPVGAVEDFVENEFQVFDVDGRSIGVVLTKEGFRAVLNQCPHQRAAICEGRLGGTFVPSDPQDLRFSDETLVITCPWHRWEFELDTGRSFGGVTRRRLLTFPVTVEDGRVLVRTTERRS